MAKRFTEFSTATQVLTTDHFVGFSADESNEYRAPINAISKAIAADLEDQIQKIVRDSVNDQNVGLGEDTSLSELGDYFGDSNPLAFTASAIQVDITYSGSGTWSPSGPIAIDLGRNYDLNIDGATRTAFRAAGGNTDLDQFPEIFGNESQIGKFNWKAMWTPQTAGTYKLFDTTATQYYLEFTVS